MSKPALKVSEWDVLHDEWQTKETARHDAWAEYQRLSQAVNAKQAAAARGHQDATPSADEMDQVRAAKKRWEAITRELATLSERMTRV